jgi:hypothetical protein
VIGVAGGEHLRLSVGLAAHLQQSLQQRTPFGKRNLFLYNKREILHK